MSETQESSPLDRAERTSSEHPLLEKLQGTLKHQALTRESAPVVTPMLLFKALLEDEGVQAFVRSKDLDPTPLLSHVERVLAAEDGGLIYEAEKGRVRGTNSVINRYFDLSLQEAEEEMQRKTLTKKESSAAGGYGYEPQLYEFISGYFATEQMHGREPSLSGLFAAAYAEYGERLGKPLEQLQETFKIPNAEDRFEARLGEERRRAARTPT